MDQDNKMKKEVAEILKTNKWVKEAKRQQQELEKAERDVKVIQLNEKANNSNTSTA